MKTEPINPAPTIIVTRHDNLAAVLHERGVNPSTPRISHVDAPQQIEGKHVIGVLPHHLSSRAASVTEIPMRWSEQDREALQRGDVDLDATRKAAGDPITYVVFELHGGGIDRGRPRWLAVARAYEHVERYGYHFGSGPGSIRYSSPTWRGLLVTIIGDGSQQAWAEVIESRGVWRPGGKGPWLDGYCQPVEPHTIPAAAGWIPGDSEWSGLGE